MSRKLEVTLVILLLIFLGFLRFYNLPYSEYIPDETTVMYPLKIEEVYTREFFLGQRKGPMQFLVAYTPILFGSTNILNEGIYRIPFAFASSLSFLFFYLFVRNISGRKLIAFLSILLLGVCGFTVGLGRIVQYQSLNLLFSSLALYFYSLLLIKEKKYVRYSLLATVFCCLSSLSHWDAVFYYPIMFWIYGRFLISKSISKDIKVKVVVSNIVLSTLILAPFMIPYFRHISENNLEYFSTRVGLGGENNTLMEKLIGYKFKIELYNPFVYLWFILGTSLIALFKFKKTKAILLWFLINFSVFLVFIRHEGTHLYNLFIPLSILSAFGLVFLVDLLNKWWKVLVAIPASLVLAFFYYQSFLIFADVKKEYPFDREIILGKETRRYTYEDLPNNVIGFPIRRGWVEINEYLAGLDYPRYITNENQSISNFYVGGNYGEGEGTYYVVGVKDPLSFVKDYTFSQIGGKHTVKEIKVNGVTTAKIYLVDGKE